MECVCERLRSRLNAARFALPDHPVPIQITISIGVAVCCHETLPLSPPARIAEDLLKIADTALYEAKGAGRNTVALVNAA